MVATLCVIVVRQTMYDTEATDGEASNARKNDADHAVGSTKPVGQLGDHLLLVQADVEFVKKRTGAADEFGHFFVDTDGGDYSEVWGVRGRVPYLDKTAHRVV
jgi:hypothetical protein